MQGETEAARSLKTRDGLGENLRGGGDLEREKCRLAPVTPEGAENSGEQDSAQDQSSWEDKQAEGEIPREEEHQEGHGACRRLTRGGDKSERTCWKERTLGETAGNGESIPFPKKARFQEGRGARKRHRPSSEGKSLKVQSLQVLSALTGGANGPETRNAGRVKTLRVDVPGEANRVNRWTVGRR